MRVQYKNKINDTLINRRLNITVAVALLRSWGHRFKSGQGETCSYE